MCARFTLTAKPADVVQQFALDGAAGLRPRFNIAPGQDVAAAVAGEGGRRALRWLRFGLVPPFADGPEFGARAINARRETADALPAFRDAFRARRCLVLADGFFEWRRRVGSAEPHHVTLPGRALFAFAGLHEAWGGASGQASLRSVAILTCPARGPLRELHDRMPVLIDPAQYDAWLDPGRSAPDDVQALLGSRLSEELEARPVDARVNDWRVDDPACLAPSPQLALL